MSDQRKTKLDCPECGKRMIESGVMLVGNLLTGEGRHPVWRLDCRDCFVIVSVEMDDLQQGWALWANQNTHETTDDPNF